MVILENIDIDIDIDKAILQNIDIDKISNRFKFGISNRATTRSGRLSNAESRWDLGGLNTFWLGTFCFVFHTNTYKYMKQRAQIQLRQL